MYKIGNSVARLLSRGKFVIGGCLAFGITTAGALFLMDEESERHRVFKSITPPTKAPIPTQAAARKAKNMDEKFILPSLGTPYFGVLAGPDGNAKTTFIKEVMAAHKTLPINYASTRPYGSCEAKAMHLLRDAFNVKGMRSWDRGSDLPWAVNAVIHAAKDYQKEHGAATAGTLQPVVIFDKVEHLQDCDKEVGMLLRAAKISGSNHSLKMVFVANTPQAEEMLLQNCDQTRHTTHVFGETKQPKVAAYY